MKITKKEYDHQRYLANKDQIIKRTTEYNQSHKDQTSNRNKKHYNAMKLKYYTNLVCSECGSKKKVMYHHINPKTKIRAVFHMLHGSNEAIEKEISKCILLCAKCHVILHWKLRKGVEIKCE